MVKILCWNIGNRSDPWNELLKADAEVALLQEVNPKHVPASIEVGPHEPWRHYGYDRWPMVAKLPQSRDRVEVEWFKPIDPAGGAIECTEIAVSDACTLAAARVTPLTGGQPFVVFSMYARWLSPHSLAEKTAERRERGMRQIRIYSDASAHRILSDLSAFIGHTNPLAHRILVAGDLNTIYGATEDNQLEDRKRMLTVFARADALGLDFVGPQWPNAYRQADPTPPGLLDDTGNVPTYYTTRQTPATAENQLDYVFASRGFHNSVTVHAINDAENWGPSDHCRISIEVL